MVAKGGGPGFLFAPDMCDDGIDNDHDGLTDCQDNGFQDCCFPGSPCCMMSGSSCMASDCMTPN